jgi:hypothetical protein
MRQHHFDTPPAEHGQALAYGAGLAVPDQPITPSAVVPAAEREPMVWIPGPGSDFVAVPKSTAEAYGYLTPAAPIPARDLTPLPAVDLLAQRMVGAGVGGGVAAAGTGWGVAQVVNALAGVGTGVGLLLLALVLAKLTSRSGGETHIHVTNNNRWWGRSTTRF